MCPYLDFRKGVWRMVAAFVICGMRCLERRIYHVGCGVYVGSVGVRREDELGIIIHTPVPGKASPLRLRTTVACSRDM